jgi:hypothetical protein
MAAGDGRHPARGLPRASRWTFLTNHAHVMVCLARDPDLTMRAVAERVGITQRAVQSIVADLARDGYLEVQHRGRNNHYVINRELPLRHPVEGDVSVAALLCAVSACSRSASPSRSSRNS